MDAQSSPRDGELTKFYLGMQYNHLLMLTTLEPDRALIKGTRTRALFMKRGDRGLIHPICELIAEILWPDVPGKLRPLDYVQVVLPPGWSIGSINRFKRRRSLKE